MKKLLLIFLLAGTALFGKSPEAEIFSEANAAYDEGNYKQAINFYDSLYTMGYESEALYYNMGNSYYRTGKYAHAILFYERAAAISPSDREVKHNLEIARKQIIDKIEKMPQPLFESALLQLVYWQTSDRWASFSLLLLMLFSVSLAVYLFRRVKRVAFITAAVSLIMGLILLSFAYWRAEHYNQHKPAIVMVTSAYVKSAPSESASDTFILHSGTRVEIRDALKGWKKIELEDGKIGWIKSESIEEV